MQNANIFNLPENYTMKYCQSHRHLVRPSACELDNLASSPPVLLPPNPRSARPQTCTTPSPGRSCRSSQRRHQQARLSGTFSQRCQSAGRARPDGSRHLRSRPLKLTCPPTVHVRRDEDANPNETPHGHVTSISVLRTHRRLGLANKLMKQSRQSDPTPLRRRPHLATRASPDLARSEHPFLTGRFLFPVVCSAEEAMATVYHAAYVSLHVRRTNRAAISLYRDSLGFEVHDVELSYCQSLTRAHARSLGVTLQRHTGRLAGVQT